MLAQEPRDLVRCRGADRALPASDMGERCRVDAEDRDGVAAGGRRPHAGDAAQDGVGRTDRRALRENRYGVVTLRPDREPRVERDVEGGRVGGTALQRRAVGPGEHDAADRGGEEPDGHDGAQRTAYPAGGRQPAGDGARRQMAADEGGDGHPEPSRQQRCRRERQHRKRDRQRVARDCGDPDGAPRGDEERGREAAHGQQLDRVPRGRLRRRRPGEHGSHEDGGQQRQQQEGRGSVEHGRRRERRLRRVQRLGTSKKPRAHPAERGPDHGTGGDGEHPADEGDPYRLAR